MHPVNYLFEDIYRNDWGVSLEKARRRRSTPWVGDLRFLVERTRS
ncbi:hypothetical protein [Mesorhizobium sp.]|nr:hypothetical protein [Mesorhizobium sp.]